MTSFPWKSARIFANTSQKLKKVRWWRSVHTMFAKCSKNIDFARFFTRQNLQYPQTKILIFRVFCFFAFFSALKWRVEPLMPYLQPCKTVRALRCLPKNVFAAVGFICVITNFAWHKKTWIVQSSPLFRWHYANFVRCWSYSHCNPHNCGIPKICKVQNVFLQKNRKAFLTKKIHIGSVSFHTVKKEGFTLFLFETLFTLLLWLLGKSNFSQHKLQPKQTQN